MRPPLFVEHLNLCMGLRVLVELLVVLVTTLQVVLGVPLHVHTGALVKHMKRFSLDYDYYAMYWTMHNIQEQLKEKAEQQG